MVNTPILGRSSFIPHPSSFIYALVPTKELLRAKTRLAGVLAPDQRRSLVLAMLRDVLGTLRAVPELDGIAVVSRDQAVRALAAQCGALLLDDHGDDLNDSLHKGTAQLLARGVNGIVVVPADVPLIAREDVATLAGALRNGRQLALTPARDGGGTNGMGLSLPSPFTFQFGIDSFSRHLAQGQHLGFDVTIHISTTLGLDIDTVEDLCALDETTGAPATRDLLHKIAFQPCEV